MAAKKKPAIPSVPVGDKATQHFLNSVKETLEVGTGQRGDVLDRFVTVRELIDSGVVRKLKYSDIYGSSNYYDFAPAFTDDDDLTPPPAPTNLTASGAFTSITLQWDKPNYGNHEKTYIYRLGTDVIGSSISISSTTANIYTDEVGYGQTYFYWIQFESKAGIKGPYNQTSGTQGQTLEDIGAVMVQLSEDITGLNGYSSLINTTIPTLISNAGAASTQIIRSNSAPTTRGDGSALQLVDLWIDTNDSNQAYTRNASNNGWEKARDSSLVALVGTTSFTGSTLTSAIATAQTNITTATGTANAASTSISNLSALVGSGNDASGNAYSSSNSIIQHVTANENNSQSSLVLQTDANGSVAQMILHSNASSGSSPTSVITFRADSFAVSNNSSTDVFPFIVDGGVVFMDTARIKDGAIQNAKLGTVSADKITTGGMNAARITSGSIDADVITLNNLDAGHITSGTMSANFISGGTISATHLQAGTLTVYNAAGSNTIGQASGNAGAFVATPQNYAGGYLGGTVSQFTNNFSSTNPMHYRPSDGQLLPQISNGGSGGIALTVPNVSGLSSIPYLFTCEATPSGYFDGDERTQVIFGINTTNSSAHNASGGWVTSRASTHNTNDTAWSPRIFSFTLNLSVNTTYYVWLFGYQYGVEDNPTGSRGFDQPTIKWMAIYK